jgi:hypothetical protein
MLGQGVFVRDLMSQRPVARRALLGSLSIVLLGGCADSPTERAHQRFFATVKKDPVFTWRPGWMTFDQESQISGNQPLTTDVGAELTRTIGGSPVPPTGVHDAIAFAIDAGWVEERPQVLKKDMRDQDVVASSMLVISARDDMSAVIMKFTSLVAR